MRQYFALLLVLAVLISAGCVEEYTPPNETANTSPATMTSAVLANTPGQNTPSPVPTPPPAETAYLANIVCGVGDKSEETYHCNGDLRIRSGAYDEVQVIARYPDNNTFKSGIATMGGSNPVLTPFAIFPDLKYKGQTPDYFVRMDRTIYPVIWNGNGGTAWSNLPAEKQLVLQNP